MGNVLLGVHLALTMSHIVDMVMALQYRAT